MSRAELRDILTSLELTQADLAALVGLTPRAVSSWMSGEREVPGPVEAYLGLLGAAPQSVRQEELKRLKRKENKMREGIYSVAYGSIAGEGYGC